MSLRPWATHLTSLWNTFSIRKIGNVPFRFVLGSEWGHVREALFLCCLVWTLRMFMSFFLSVFSFFPFSPFKVPEVSSVPFLSLLIQVSLPLIPIANIPLFCPNHSMHTSPQSQTNAHENALNVLRECSHFSPRSANWHTHSLGPQQRGPEEWRSIFPKSQVYLDLLGRLGRAEELGRLENAIKFHMCMIF